MTEKHTRPSLPVTLLALLVCLVLLPAWRLGPAVSFFEAEGGIPKAIAELAEGAGGITRVLSINIEPKEVSVEAQDPRNPRHVNRWSLVPADAKWVHWHKLKGPDPVQLTAITKDLEASLFDLAEVDFGAAKDLMAEALARAGLEDAATVTSMEIRRPPMIIQRQQAGAVRWTVHVRSEREHANIVADAKGKIVRLDLGGTSRARQFNLLGSLELVVDAARAFAEEVGTEPVLLRVGIASRGASFQTNIPGAPLFGSIKQNQVARWSLNGLELGAGSMDLSKYFGEKPTFAIGDVDWKLIEGLPERAKAALGMPNGSVVDIDVDKPEDQAALPVIEIRVEIQDANLDKGEVRFDTNGAITGKTLPESRRIPFDARDPANWPALLAKIEETFGAEGQIAELLINQNQISIQAADPLKPQELAQFLLDDTGIRRFGTASFFAASNPRFTVAEIRALTGDQMKKLVDATVARLGLPTTQIVNITVGKASLDPSPQGNVTVEVRAEEAPFKRSGRVNWEIDGREIKAYLP